MVSTYNMFSPLANLGNATQPFFKRKKLDENKNNKSKTIEIQTSASYSEKYLVMKHIEDGKSLAKLSPFGIQKALEMITTGITKTQRTRAGELLILAKNGAASNALLKTNNLGTLARVKVIEHPTLNSTKGIVFCRDLMEMSEDEIQEGFAEQGVVEVRKLKRWVNKELKDTASLVLTFNTPALPDFVKAGFLKLNVRLYIPNPMRCTTCLKFGHTKKRCLNQQICIKCSEIMPHEAECTIIRCINCKQAHQANNRDCPVFKRELAIIKIKTEERLTFHEAKSKYFRLYANTTPAVSYAETLKENMERQPNEQKQSLQMLQTFNKEKNQQQIKNKEEQTLKQATSTTELQQTQQKQQKHQQQQQQPQQQEPQQQQQQLQQQTAQQKSTTTNSTTKKEISTQNNKNELIKRKYLFLNENERDIVIHMDE